jgi:hypothetical protein
MVKILRANDPSAGPMNEKESRSKFGEAARRRKRIGVGERMSVRPLQRKSFPSEFLRHNVSISTTANAPLSSFEITIFWILRLA